MCAVARIGDAHLWRVVNDNNIRAALHGAYQIVIHLATVDHLMENQDINLASSGVIICDGINPRMVEKPEASTFRPVSWMRRQLSPKTVLSAWVSRSILVASNKCGDWAVNCAILILTLQTATMAFTTNE